VAPAQVQHPQTRLKDFVSRMLDHKPSKAPCTSILVSRWEIRKGDLGWPFLRLIMGICLEETHLLLFA